MTRPAGWIEGVVTRDGESDRNVAKVVNFSKRGDATRKRFCRKLYWRIFRLHRGRLYPLDLTYRNRPYPLNRLIVAKRTDNPRLSQDSDWYKRPMFCGFTDIQQCADYFHHLRGYCFPPKTVLVMLPVYLFGRGEAATFCHKRHKSKGVRAPEMLIPTIGYRAFVRPRRID